MHISDIVRHKRSAGTDAVHTIGAAESVRALVAALADQNIGALLVVDGTTVIGIVSERDVVRRIAEKGGDLLDHHVEQIMTTAVLSCTSTDSVDEIAETMTERRIRHMPVLDDGVLTGIISIGDVVSSRIRQLELDRGQLEQYISG